MAMVSMLLLLILFANSGSLTPLSSSAFLITGCEPIRRVIQPMTGMVMMSCLPMAMMRLSCDFMIARGSMSPLMCVEAYTDPPSISGGLSISECLMT